eukprot:scaffold12443_cov108-Isochrysis_galbana.AAC.7
MAANGARQPASPVPPCPLTPPLPLPGASNAHRPTGGCDVPGCRLSSSTTCCSLDWWGHGPSSLFPS